MAESCSSNIPNGCQVCGPGLVLFQLSASTSQNMVGKGCLNGDNPSPKKVYFSESSNASFNYNGSDNIIDLSVNDTASYVYTENITCFIDVYGVIICTSTLSSNNSYSDNYHDKYNGSSSAGSINCSKAPRKSSCEPDPETKCYLGGDCAKNPEFGCPDGPEGWNCLQETCNDSLSCTSHTRSGSESSSISNQFYYAQGSGSYSFRRTISSTKNLSYFYDLCKSSVSTKISILTNNKPQNCAKTKCGDGGKDDCWGGAACFGIVDNNLDDPNATSTTSQKLKFKIGILKKEFNEEYKSVSGKIKFYIQSEKDAEEGRTPCCNDDFSGTVVKEQDYSISAGETFKNDYFASDAGDFDNNDQSLVGKTINICYTIDKVSFI
jgi:hypothetical protein